MVVNKTVIAKIDRLEGVVHFTETKTPTEILNDWSYNTRSLMTLINQATHLINKERVLHAMWTVYSNWCLKKSLILDQISDIRRFNLTLPLSLFYVDIFSCKSYNRLHRLPPQTVDNVLSLIYADAISALSNSGKNFTRDITFDRQFSWWTVQFTQLEQCMSVCM